KFKPCLARFLVHPRRHDHHLTSGEISVLSRANRHRLGKRDCMENVVGFGFRPLLIEVYQHDFTSDPAHHQRICRRRTDQPRPHNPYLHSLSSCSEWITQTRIVPSAPPEAINFPDHNRSCSRSSTFPVHPQQTPMQTGSSKPPETANPLPSHPL